MTLAAVVLAAGASTRMGRPKALLSWKGRSFLEHVVDLARAASCTPIVVVEGATRLRDDVGPHVTLVRNEDWSRGPLSSLQTALPEVPPGHGVLVLTVDRPHLAASTIEALARAHGADSTRVWQPCHHGTRGHPIVYPADLVPALRQLDPIDSPRSLLRRPGVEPRRATVDVDDPAVVENIDTQAAYETLVHRTA